MSCFDEIDVNGGGMILFDELCHWLATEQGRTWCERASRLQDLKKRLQVSRETEGVGYLGPCSCPCRRQANPTRQS
jgi:hypothetical protein